MSVVKNNLNFFFNFLSKLRFYGEFGETIPIPFLTFRDGVGSDRISVVYILSRVSMRKSFSFHTQMVIVAVFCILHLSFLFNLAEFHILCVHKGHSARFIEEEALKT